jgi:hypothetical protein
MLVDGLHQALGSRDPLFRPTIVEETRRPGWFWIRVDRFWTLMRQLSDEEIVESGRPESIGFAAARVRTRIQALAEFGIRLP